MRILLIEDEVKVAELLADAFTDDGHPTTVALCGLEGLEHLARQRPDAVFLDVRLPDINGIEVLRRIRSTDAALPVILITGHASSEEIAEARRLGVVEVIEKPYILRHLGEVLGRLGGSSGG